MELGATPNFGDSIEGPGVFFEDARHPKGAQGLMQGGNPKKPTNHAKKNQFVLDQKFAQNTPLRPILSHFERVLHFRNQEKSFAVQLPEGPKGHLENN